MDLHGSQQQLSQIIHESFGRLERLERERAILKHGLLASTQCRDEALDRLTEVMAEQVSFPLNSMPPETPGSAVIRPSQPANRNADDVFDETQLMSQLKDTHTGIQVRDRWWRLKMYPACFVGSDLVDWLISTCWSPTRHHAVNVGRLLAKKGLIYHAGQGNLFQDGYYYYRFKDPVPSVQHRTWAFSPTVKALSAALPLRLAQRIESATDDVNQLRYLKELRRNVLYIALHTTGWESHGSRDGVQVYSMVKTVPSPDADKKGQQHECRLLKTVGSVPVTPQTFINQFLNFEERRSWEALFVPQSAAVVDRLGPHTRILYRSSASPLPSIQPRDACVLQDHFVEPLEMHTASSSPNGTPESSALNSPVMSSAFKRSATLSSASPDQRHYQQQQQRLATAAAAVGVGVGVGVAAVSRTNSVVQPQQQQSPQLHPQQQQHQQQQQHARSQSLSISLDRNQAYSTLHQQAVDAESIGDLAPHSLPNALDSAASATTADAFSSSSSSHANRSNVDATGTATTTTTTANAAHHRRMASQPLPVSRSATESSFGSNGADLSASNSSSPAYHVVYEVSVEHERAPILDGHVRAEVYLIAHVVRPHPDDPAQSEITVVSQVDFRGERVPEWLIDKWIGQQTVEHFRQRPAVTTNSQAFHPQLILADSGLDSVTSSAASTPMQTPRGGGSASTGDAGEGGGPFSLLSAATTTTAPAAASASAVPASLVSSSRSHHNNNNPNSSALIGPTNPTALTTTTTTTTATHHSQSLSSLAAPAHPPLSPSPASSASSASTRAPSKSLSVRTNAPEGKHNHNSTSAVPPKSRSKPPTPSSSTAAAATATAGAAGSNLSVSLQNSSSSSSSAAVSVLVPLSSSSASAFPAPASSVASSSSSSSSASASVTPQKMKNADLTSTALSPAPVPPSSPPSSSNNNQRWSMESVSSVLLPAQPPPTPASVDDHVPDAVHYHQTRHWLVSPPPHTPDFLQQHQQHQQHSQQQQSLPPAAASSVASKPTLAKQPAVPGGGGFPASASTSSSGPFSAKGLKLPMPMDVTPAAGGGGGGESIADLKWGDETPPGSPAARNGGAKGSPTGSGSTSHVGARDFEPLSVIGQGACSKIMQVRFKNTQQIFAMKVLRKKDIVNAKHVAHVREERDILTRISHPYIVRLFYSFQSKTKLYMVMTYAAGGDLFSALRRTALTEGQACLFAAELSLALHYLHSQNVAHRDVKPENVMLSHDGHVLLTDFGLSKQIQGGRTLSRSGTAEYLAPEMLLNTGHGVSVDWWQLGIVLHEMLTGKHPFYNQNTYVMHHAILHRAPRLDPALSIEAKNCILGLLNKDPQQRLQFADKQRLHGDAFFKKHRISWDMIQQQQVQSALKPYIADSRDVRNFDEVFTSQPAIDTPDPSPCVSVAPSASSPSNLAVSSPSSEVSGPPAGGSPI